jgi:hypothetical protein
MTDYAQSTADTLRNRPTQIDSQINAIDPPRAAPSPLDSVSSPPRITQQAAPSTYRSMPDQSAINPANSVPADDEGFFHKVGRRVFGL